MIYGLTMLLAEWQNPDQIIATTGVLTFIALVAAAILAWLQIRSARQARKERDRPFVIVDIEGQHKIFFRLVVKNIGKTIASDVTLKFDPPLTSTLDVDSRQVSAVPFLAKPIPSLPPGKSFGVLFDRAPDRIKEKDKFPDRYQVELTYSAYDGTTFIESQVIDLGPFWEAPDLTAYGLHDVHTELKKIGVSLGGIQRELANLQPPSDVRFGPLPRAVSRPQDGEATIRGIAGEGFPITDESDDS